MKIKTNELIGPALDSAVAIAQGAVAEMQSGGLTWLVEGALLGYACSYIPSEDWEQGGPIIEQEMINLVSQGDAHDWVASRWDYEASDWAGHITGPTPLIAAMRAFVASKLGDVVEVPGELE